LTKEKILVFYVMLNRTAVLLFILITILYSQTDWAKYLNNPVMVKQNLLTEFYAIGQPTVIMENDTFKMWYGAAGIDHRGRILYAYSVNGINWTKYQNGAIVLNIGSAGEWDAKWLDTPEIVRSPTDYKLFYYGDVVDTFPPHSAAIGLATSTNGINWTKHPNNPIFTKGESLSWEGYWIESPAVLYDEEIYKMWYTGVPYDWRIRIGYATSSDGVSWIKHPNNPVLDVGAPGSWDDMWVAVPAVIKRNNRFEMFYSALSEADIATGRYDTIRIGYATSYDGVNWTKYPEPVLTTLTPPHNPAVDSNGPWAPDVVFDGTNYRMWYETAAGFCYATAPLSVIEFGEQRPITAVEISPNPFHSYTLINCPGHFSFKVFDVSGKLHKSLSGQDRIVWDGRNEHRQKLRSGVYFGVLLIGDCKQTQKLVIY
jgi:predicted GH43/DUF377 family glycosyl hydrolase